MLGKIEGRRRGEEQAFWVSLGNGLASQNEPRPEGMYGPPRP